MGSGELGAYAALEDAGLCHRCPFCPLGGISEGGLVCLSLEPEQRAAETAPVSLLILSVPRRTSQCFPKREAESALWVGDLRACAHLESVGRRICTLTKRYNWKVPFKHTHT